MLKAISPIDWRYSASTKGLGQYFSEFALIKYRIYVEVEFLKFLIPVIWIKLNKDQKLFINNLDSINNNFSLQDTERVKEIEKTTNHDVKAVEYFLKEKLFENTSVESNEEISELIHFACTSEDINNIAYSLMIKDWITNLILPAIEKVSIDLNKLANNWANIPMLSRTHWQSASPTTVWKEFKIFESRINREISNIKKQEYLGKINWASGNFNAHYIAYPEINWIEFSKEFIESLWLNWNAHTNQIEPHDFLAEIFDSWSRISTILIDFNKDIWQYISIWYFKQKVIVWEIWSSAMPHKVNPIDFENSEWNCWLAIAIFQHLARKLPISRMQRDLTDSTVLRNIWVGFAYLLIAIKSAEKWMNKLELNVEKLENDLDNNWEILAEAIQTVMRKNGVEKPYEKLKVLTRGKKLDKKTLQDFIKKLELEKEDKQRLLSLTPNNYIWLAEKLAIYRKQ